MPNCDLCGKSEESLYKAEIEKVVLNVCSGCSKYGRIVQRPRRVEKRPKRQFTPQQEVAQGEDVVVGDFAQKIKQKREQLGMNQKEFAQRINQKESVAHSLENGSLKPSLDLARKLQRTLHIRLVEQEKETAVLPSSGAKSSAFTLGDFIKKKK